MLIFNSSIAILFYVAEEGLNDFSRGWRQSTCMGHMRPRVPSLALTIPKEKLQPHANAIYIIATSTRGRSRSTP